MSARETYVICLGETAEIVMGQAPPGSDCNQESLGMPFIKAGEFQDRFPVIREWTTNPLKEARRGDALVCVVGATAGKVNEGIDCSIGRSVAAVRPDLSRLCSTYLYHFLRTQVLSLRAKSQGLAQGVITREMLQQVLLPVPSLIEQRRIAAILDKADALRAKRRAALAQLDALTQSIFLDMFGDPMSANTLWSRYSLKDVCLKITDGTHRTPIYQQTGIEFLSAKDLKDGQVRWGSGKFISVEEHRVLVKRCNPELGDILLAKSGSLGNVAIVDRAHKFSLFESLCLIKPDRSRLQSGYLASLLRSPSMLSHLLGKNKGVAIKHLHLVDVKGLRVPVPPLDLQIEFVRRAEKSFDLRRIAACALSNLDALFASLQRHTFAEISRGSK